MQENRQTLTGWIIPKIKDGLSDESIWLDYLADDSINWTQNAESSVKRRARGIRETLTKYEMLVEEDFDRATRLLSRIDSENGNLLELAIKSYDIKDINGLMDWANLKDDQWECYAQTVRASQNQNTPWFIVEGKFRKKDKSKISVEELIEKYQKKLNEYTPLKIQVPKLKSGKYLLEISLPDLHLGNMNFKDTETLDTTVKRFKDAVASFLARTSHFDLDEIVFTVGSDFFTINADMPETKKGTPQDINAYYDKIYDVGLEVVIDTIYTLRNHARKVHVIGFPGNHDEQSVIWLMLALKHVFQKTEGVFVDWEYNKIKYHRFGCTALAFTHKLRKKLETLPLRMFHEMIDQGLIDRDIKYYEIHGGDTHIPNKQEMPAETTNQKITQRVLSSLTDNSRWAHDGFGEKVIEGQAFIYDYDKGIQNVMVWRPG